MPTPIDQLRIASAANAAMRAKLEVMAGQRLISEMHPDQVGGNYEGAYEVFIKGAREVLIANPDTTAADDEILKAADSEILKAYIDRQTEPLRTALEETSETTVTLSRCRCPLKPISGLSARLLCS